MSTCRNSAAAAGEADIRVPGRAVLAVVEVACPATMPLNRAVRPAMCADAGIPSLLMPLGLAGTRTGIVTPSPHDGASAGHHAPDPRQLTGWCPARRPRCLGEERLGAADLGGTSCRS